MAVGSKKGARLEEAQRLAADQPAKAEAIYKEILSKPPGTSDAELKEFETALLSLGELYRDHKKVNELVNLIHQGLSSLSSFAKAKTAKLGERHLNQFDSTVPDVT